MAAAPPGFHPDKPTSSDIVIAAVCCAACVRLLSSAISVHRSAPERPPEMRPSLQTCLKKLEGLGSNTLWHSLWVISLSSQRELLLLRNRGGTESAVRTNCAKGSIQCQLVVQGILARASMQADPTVCRAFVGLCAR